MHAASELINTGLRTFSEEEKLAYGSSKVIFGLPLRQVTLIGAKEDKFMVGIRGFSDISDAISEFAARSSESWSLSNDC